MLLGGRVFRGADFDREAAEFDAGRMAFKEQHWSRPDARVPPVLSGREVDASSHAAGVQCCRLMRHSQWPDARVQRWEVGASSQRPES